MAASLTKRLEVLEAAAQIQMDVIRLHNPYVAFEPWNMSKNQYNVYYYPEGKYKPAIKYSNLDYWEACKLLLQWPGDLYCQIRMDSCLEWLFALHHFADRPNRYTQEQLDRLQTKELDDNPELSYLVDTEEGKQLAKVLAKLPQNEVVELRNFQIIIEPN